MNREIKFRGLRVDGKGWVYGYYYEYNSKSYIGFQDLSDNSETGYNHEVTPESVGQFTGLKDKNEVDIYEGDKLHFKTYEGGGFGKVGLDAYAEVVYGDHNFTDTVLNRAIGFYLLTGKNHRETSIGYWIYSHKATVIGNIHENPELLCQ